MVPFLNAILGTMLPMLGMAKQDNMKWVFSSGEWTWWYSFKGFLSHHEFIQSLGKKKTYLAKCFTFAHVMTPVLCLMLSPCVHITHLWIEVSLSSTEGTCAFSPSVTALSHFSESILEYLANLDKAPDPTVRKDTFSSEIYASYDILFCNWLQSREPKVHLTRKSTAPIKANPVCAQRLFFCTNRSHGMPAGRPLISLPAVSKISSH